MGEIGSGEDVLVRLHSECLTGGVFGSLRCACGSRLDAALAAVARERRGIVLYIRGHSTGGLGLLHKLRAYEREDGLTADVMVPLSPIRRRTSAITARARRSSPIWAFARCGCSRTIPRSGPDWRATDFA
jgi:GTP cyclohydrolase II